MWRLSDVLLVREQCAFSYVAVVLSGTSVVCYTDFFSQIELGATAPNSCVRN
jgi:hypothetical protein